MSTAAIGGARGAVFIIQSPSKSPSRGTELEATLAARGVPVRTLSTLELDRAREPEPAVAWVIEARAQRTEDLRPHADLARHLNLPFRPLVPGGSLDDLLARLREAPLRATVLTFTRDPRDGRAFFPLWRGRAAVWSALASHRLASCEEATSVAERLARECHHLSLSGGPTTRCAGPVAICDLDAMHLQVDHAHLYEGPRLDRAGRAHTEARWRRRSSEARVLAAFLRWLREPETREDLMDVLGAEEARCPSAGPVFDLFMDEPDLAPGLLAERAAAYLAELDLASHLGVEGVLERAAQGTIGLAELDPHLRELEALGERRELRFVSALDLVSAAVGARVAMPEDTRPLTLLEPERTTILPLCSRPDLGPVIGSITRQLEPVLDAAAAEGREHILALDLDSTLLTRPGRLDPSWLEWQTNERPDLSIERLARLDDALSGMPAVPTEPGLGDTLRRAMTKGWTLLGLTARAESSDALTRLQLRTADLPVSRVVYTRPTSGPAGRKDTALRLELERLSLTRDHARFQVVFLDDQRGYRDEVALLDGFRGSNFEVTTHAFLYTGDPPIQFSATHVAGELAALAARSREIAELSCDLRASPSSDPQHGRPAPSE